MRCLEYLATDKGVIFAYNSEVMGIEKIKDGYKIIARDRGDDQIEIFSKVAINSAGLNSDKIAQAAGIDIEKSGYRLHYSKGEYFRVKAKKSSFIKRLIYPTPEEGSLGIHTVIDLKGELKLGPNAFYVDNVNYDVENSHAAEFYESAKRYLKFIEPDDLSPDISGIRPKLQAKGEPSRDFVISEEEEKGYPGLINLIGIESPGLTASLAIAEYVGNMI